MVQIKSQQCATQAKHSTTPANVCSKWLKCIHETENLSHGATIDDRQQVVPYYIDPHKHAVVSLVLEGTLQFHRPVS